MTFLMPLIDKYLRLVQDFLRKYFVQTCAIIGTRSLSLEHCKFIELLGAQLGAQAIWVRTGYAEGTDKAISQGIAVHDPSLVTQVLPNDTSSSPKAKHTSSTNVHRYFEVPK